VPSNKIAIACLLVLFGFAFPSACGDDDSGTPDAGGDVEDTALDVPPEAEPDDAARPDEPIGPGDYPPGPYGIAVGDRLEDLRFVDVDGEVLTLADIHNDRAVKLLWIYASAGWCGVCGSESARLPALWNTYHPQGLQILGVIFEDTSGNPATVAYAASYARRYSWPFPAVADQPFVLGRYFDKAATPMNMLVDLTDMTILRVDMGWDEGGMTGQVQRYLTEIADRD
jgi:peroxiredoxin